MKLNRLFEIVYILQDEKTVTATALAKRFEVSVRTIYRDVEILSQVGIPIYMSRGKGGGVSLLPDFVLNKAVLTKEEREELLSSVKAVNSVKFSNGESVSSKLDSMLGKDNADWIEVDFSSWNDSSEEEEYFHALKRAILDRRYVSFSYASAKKERTQRRVAPLKLVFKGAAWYLYGFCTERKDHRFFKLRRIEALTTKEETFEMVVPKNVCEKNIFEDKPLIRTVFLISSKFAYRIYDEFREYERLENGDFRCTIFMPGLDTIVDYASTFGADCTIIEPKEAYELMRKRLKRMIKKYENKN